MVFSRQVFDVANLPAVPVPAQMWMSQLVMDLKHGKLTPSDADEQFRRRMRTIHYPHLDDEYIEHARRYCHRVAGVQ